MQPGGVRFEPQLVYQIVLHIFMECILWELAYVIGLAWCSFLTDTDRSVVKKLIVLQIHYLKERKNLPCTSLNIQNIDLYFLPYINRW